MIQNCAVWYGSHYLQVCPQYLNLNLLTLHKIKNKIWHFKYSVALYVSHGHIDQLYFASSENILLNCPTGEQEYTN
jgi:hypothetical protein